MLALRLAYRNLVGAGLRTWLNVAVLSMAYVLIIWQQGFLEGWNVQARRDMIEWEVGGGQYWHEEYDPYDVFTIEESHAPLPEDLRAHSEDGTVAPVLITTAAIYPQGRIQNVLLKGIGPEQSVLRLPSASLGADMEEIPLLLGTRMARSTGLNVDDLVTVRWRDVNGTFDAAEGKIVRIMKTNVPAVDQGTLWLPLERLQEMLRLPGEATLAVVSPGFEADGAPSGWIFRDRKYLLSEITDIIEMKRVGGYVFYALLLSLALLAILDTQVFSIFRRRREIGTLIALGMTRGDVICLFTVEGAMHGVLAIGAAALYGIPLLRLQATRGFPMPKAVDRYGLAIAEKLFPVYGAGLVTGTVLIVLAAVTVVSFLPARRIAKMNPTDAIKGKLT